MAVLIIFAQRLKRLKMGVLSLVLVLVLFVLAIISPKIFPNKMVSDNKHDVDGSTEEAQH